MRDITGEPIGAGDVLEARDLAHTEREIAYYIDRLDIIDEQVDEEVLVKVSGRWVKTP